MTVIDSLSKGFQVVRQRWWILLIPILVDTFLWLGPQASVHDMFQKTAQLVEAQLAELPAQDTGELLELLDVVVNQILPEYNAFSALRVSILGVPSLLSWNGTARLGAPSIYETLWVTFLGLVDIPDLLVLVTRAKFVPDVVWQIPNAAAWLGVNLGLNALGVVLGSLYLTALSRGIGAEREDSRFWICALRLCGHVVLFWVLRAVVIAVLGIPFLGIVALLSMLSPVLGILLGTIVLGLVTWASFYGIFMVASLVLDGTTVWRALWNSFGVVLRSFWPTLWLFVLINLIGGGLSILWQQFSTGRWWTWVAIAGNADVGTSLVAASLLFYQDRYTRWRERLAEVLANLNSIFGYGSNIHFFTSPL